MLAPNAENIEGATEILFRDLATGPAEYPLLTKFIYDAQLNELHSAVGAQDAEKLGVAFPISEDFKVGYMLGVQAARMVLCGSVALALAKVKPEDVL